MHSRAHRTIDAVVITVCQLTERFHADQCPRNQRHVSARKSPQSRRYRFERLAPTKFKRFSNWIMVNARSEQAIHDQTLLPQSERLQLVARELIPEIASRGRGVIMTMGKGGVGKTTVAAVIAVALARQGYSVHLTTTDPAGHASALGGTLVGLEVSRIDPAIETRVYTQEVLAEAGKGLDEKGRALLEEDLRSPCTEEIAVFRAFARKVDQGNNGFVVIATAPTGHTLLLLDAANAYHREVERNLSYIPA